MSLKNEFLQDWENVKNIIKLEIDKNIKFMRPIEPSKLKEKYSDNVKIWEASAMHEGKWLNNTKDERFKADFLAALKNIDFDYEIEKGKETPISSIFFILGIMVFVLIKFVLVKPMWFSLITAFVVIFIGAIYGKKEKKKNIENYQNKIKETIVKILEDKGDEIGELCEKFEKNK